MTAVVQGFSPRAATLVCLEKTNTKEKPPVGVVADEFLPFGDLVVVSSRCFSSVRVARTMDHKPVVAGDGPSSDLAQLTAQLRQCKSLTLATDVDLLKCMKSLSQVGSPLQF